jgi:hypothetical protein
LHIRSAAFEHRHLHAAFLVEMHVQRRLREIVVIVEFLRESFGQIARVVVLDIDQRRDAMTRARDLDGGLL